MARRRSYYVSVNVDVDIDLDDIGTDEIIDYLENNGYKVIRKKNDEEENNSDDDGSQYPDYVNAIRYITNLCHKHDYNRTFYQELIASLLNMPSYTDKDVLVRELMERLKDVLP